MIERQIDSPMPRRSLGRSRLEHFGRKSAIRLKAQGDGRGSLARSCSRSTRARIRRCLLAGGHHGPRDLHSHVGNAGRLGQWALWHRRRSVVRNRMAPLANRSGIKEPNDEYEILSLRRERTTTAAQPPASLSWPAMLDRQLCHHLTKQRRF
jgi:hypothetical protein